MKKILFSLSFAFIIQISFCTAQTNNAAKVKIWNPKSLCDLQDTIKLPYGFYCTTCKFDILKCNDIIKKGPFKSVHVRLNQTTDSAMSLSGKFKNIYLINKNGGKFHPEAMVYYNAENIAKPFIGYLYKKFRGINTYLKLQVNKPIDLIFLFKEAESGDKLIIENFLEAVIE